MTNRANSKMAEVKVRLGTAWKLKGDVPVALQSFREAISLDPNLVTAHINLGDLLLETGSTLEALSFYDEALRLEPDNPELEFRRRYLGGLVSNNRKKHTKHQIGVPLEDNPEGRIRFSEKKRFDCLRGGWDAGVAALRQLHNSRGVLLDTFIEDNFAWKHRREGVREPNVLKRLMAEGTFDELATSEEQGITPYRDPWVGFVHNPHNMPEWFHFNESPQRIFAKHIWRESIEHCLGLFCLSEYQAEWLRGQTGKPVSVLTLTAEIPDTQFSWEAFEEGNNRRVVQVGWWLRRLGAIYRLPLGPDNPLGYTKVRLVPRFFDDADRYLRELIAREEQETGASADLAFGQNTEDIQHLKNEEYDRLLSENLVFVDLYDSGANNTVVECIARGTPLLVNPLPSVVEYLGRDYPLYFNDLKEAASKALDLGRVREAHLYLKDCPTRAKLSPEYFRKTFEASEVYSALPEAG